MSESLSLTIKTRDFSRQGPTMMIAVAFSAERGLPFAAGRNDEFGFGLKAPPDRGLAARTRPEPRLETGFAQ
jgi:hypothetical protein